MSRLTPTEIRIDLGNSAAAPGIANSARRRQLRRLARHRMDGDSRREQGRTDPRGIESARKTRRAIPSGCHGIVSAHRFNTTRRARALERHTRVQAPRLHLRHHDLGLHHPRPPRIASAPRPRIHPVDSAPRHQRVLLHPPCTRHAPLKIDEIAPLLRERGISVEYGGHVLQLSCRATFSPSTPSIFPAGGDGVRAARGNLCVSNPEAVSLVRAGALAYVREVIPKTSCFTSGEPMCGTAHGADAVNAANCRRRFSTWRSSTRSPLN